MAGPCKCAREHDPVSLAEWTWQMRELKPKPPPGYLGILWMLAARLDVRTGCGWASVRDLSELSGAGRNTVLRATAWARNHGLLARTARGHRVTDERDAASQWQLLDAGQSTSGGTLATKPKSQTGRAKVPNGPSQSPTRRTQASPSQERPSQALSRRRSLRERLAEAARTDVDEREFTDLKTRLRENGIRDVAALIGSRIADGTAAELIEDLRAPVVSVTDQRVRQGLIAAAKFAEAEAREIGGSDDTDEWLGRGTYW